LENPALLLVQVFCEYHAELVEAPATKKLCPSIKFREQISLQNTTVAMRFDKKSEHFFCKNTVHKKG